MSRKCKNNKEHKNKAINLYAVVVVDWTYYSFTIYEKSGLTALRNMLSSGSVWCLVFITILMYNAH